MSAYLASSPPAGSWDSALLAPIAEINEQMLELLKSMATDVRLAGEHATPRLVSALREDWRRLDVKAQRRLSGCPYLLLDAEFSRAARWHRQLFEGVMDAPAPASYFVGRNGVALIRRLLVLAWHLARSNRLMASLVLGLSGPVAESIAAARLRDLEAIAELAPPWIAPRWEQRPIIWQQLIAAACSDKPLLLRQAQLRGLQLLASQQTRA